MFSKCLSFIKWVMFNNRRMETLIARVLNFRLKPSNSTRPNQIFLTSLEPLTSEEKDSIKKYESKYIGKRCFVVGNGPSLTKTKLELLKNEYTFGANLIFMMTEINNFKPTFYMIEDSHVASDNLERIWGYDHKKKFIPSQYRRFYSKMPNTLFYPLDLSSSRRSRPDFSVDCSNHVYCGGSVTYISLQLAFYMGFTEVYLVGVDFDYKKPTHVKVRGRTWTSMGPDPNHFHPDYFGPGRKWHDPQLDRVAVYYKLARQVFGQSRRTLKNATIGGKLDIFERVDYDSLF